MTSLLAECSASGTEEVASPFFNYCVADESGFFTKKQAKKLAIKLARKIEKSTVIETKMGIKLKRNNTND
jgi:hypothetical protein